MVANLIISTIAFFATSYFAKRWANDNDLPKGMTLNAAIFALALVVSYGVGWLIDHLIG
ncbi:MAG TPA: hypothetical protein VEU32_10625 [Burkholderiales bacterium]|nr:hypothetical protein [Burkholderiales bacterium]